jgi:GDPmannose 4,6-dehydratase
MAKTALLTGITGQDGAYLARFLLSRGYSVYGVYRRLSTPNFWRLQALDIYEDVRLVPADVTDMSSLLEAVSLAQPDEVYNLAAQSFVGASFQTPLTTGDVDGLGVTRLLEVLRILNSKARFYQASSSEIYGNTRADELPLREDTPMRPSSPYAAAKLYSYHVARIYREGYGMFVANGVLFNHESPLRGLEFVTRKVSNAVARIKLGLEQELALGNLTARRDWGYAPEYVEAMWLMLQQGAPDDFVVATGTSHSVEELLAIAFGVLGLNWRDHVRTESRFLRPIDVNHLLGDTSKAKAILGWTPRTAFPELVEIMVRADYDNWRRYLSGQTFPWDAPNYPTETRVSRSGLTI